MKKKKIVSVPSDGTYHDIFTLPDEEAVIETEHAVITIHAKHFASSHCYVCEGGLILGTKVIKSPDFI